MRKPGSLVPLLEFETLDGAGWRSRERSQDQYRLLVIYRGMWCPHCKEQLRDLEALHDSFKEVNVSVVAVSADTRERCAASVQAYGVHKLCVGFDIPIAVARDMGVFISEGINDKEMPLFCEPASFLINSENRIQAAWIASNAFARTRIQDVRNYIDFLTAHPNRAPRGAS